MLNKLFGQNANDTDRVKDLRKLNEALRKRGKGYPPTPHAPPDSIVEKNQE